MLQHVAEKTAITIKKYIESKSLDKIGLNILFVSGMMGQLYFEWITSLKNLGELVLWVVLIVTLLVISTRYFAKKIGVILPIYAVLLYCVLDCQMKMIMMEYFSYFGPFPLSSFLKIKSVFIVIIIYLVLRTLSNKISFESDECPKRGNKHVFQIFQLLLMIGAVSWGEVVYVIDMITTYKLPQIALWIIALTGLLLVICAGYGLDKRFESKFFFGISPLLYSYKAFAYLLFPENFDVALTTAYPWMKAIGCIVN